MESLIEKVKEYDVSYKLIDAQILDFDESVKLMCFYCKKHG